MIRKLFAKKKLKVGLVLSGGGARGLAHIGVLKVLDKNGIKPDFIAANSMGGVIGAMYAKNCDINEVEDYINNFKLKDFVKLFDFSRSKSGVFKGENFVKYLNKFMNNADFKDLKIPLVVNATDINTGKEIILNSGNVSTAIRSTISLPGILKPVEDNGLIIVDGTLINPLPINLLKKYNPDIIICSNVITKINEKNNDINHILKKSFIIMSNEIIRLNLKEHKYDFLIEPDLSHFDFYNFLKRKEIIEKGVKSTEKIIDLIKKKCKIWFLIIQNLFK